MKAMINQSPRLMEDVIETQQREITALNKALSARDDTIRQLERDLRLKDRLMTSLREELQRRGE